jgi:hypothetical protein
VGIFKLVTEETEQRSAQFLPPLLCFWDIAARGSASWPFILVLPLKRWTDLLLEQLSEPHSFVIP